MVTRRADRTNKLGFKHEKQRLDDELERLKQKIGLGVEVGLLWRPGDVKCKDGKKLLEEVLGNKIIIYARKPADARQLLAHGFVEWLLNEHTRPYRQLINKLITLFEEQQYQKKEKTVEALAELLTSSV